MVYRQDIQPMAILSTQEHCFHCLHFLDSDKFKVFYFIMSNGSNALNTQKSILLSLCCRPKKTDYDRRRIGTLYEPFYSRHKKAGRCEIKRVDLKKQNLNHYCQPKKQTSENC